MTDLLQVGDMRARIACADADLDAVFSLRARVFRGGAEDRDAHDAHCQHLVVRDTSGLARAACRLRIFAQAADLADSYAARSYDLTPLAAYPGPLLELGRFCLDPRRPDADTLRLAWAAITRIVESQKVRMMFGCASFAGTDPAPLAHSFALLHARHLGPAQWRPQARAPERVALAATLPGPLDLRRAQSALPPLLRTYLAMGGWVSDHAVIDRDLGTIHAFTGVEVARIPEARKRALRALYPRALDAAAAPQ